MHLSSRILGKHIADQIASKARAPLLEVGTDKFYRRDLSNVACFNLVAASNLSKLIAGLQVRNLRDLFDRVPPSALVIPHLGAVSLAVLGAAFEVKGIGGDTPLETWFAKHSQRADRDYGSFHSLKHAEAVREQGETHAKRARARRTAVRRDQAQRIRGDRYLTRQTRTRNGSVQ